MSTEGLTSIPPPGWPKAIIAASGIIYRVSKSRRRWQSELSYFGRHRGVYYTHSLIRRGYTYAYYTHEQANNMIAPEALPKWLRVSEGL